MSAANSNANNANNTNNDTNQTRVPLINNTYTINLMVRITTPQVIDSTFGRDILNGVNFSHNDNLSNNFDHQVLPAGSYPTSFL